MPKDLVFEALDYLRTHTLVLTTAESCTAGGSTGHRRSTRKRLRRLFAQRQKTTAGREVTNN